MNARLKKILLVVLAVALLASGGFMQRSMNTDRQKLGLTRLSEPLENMPPVLAFTTVALGGFRGLISNALWIRANELQEQDKFFEMAQLAEWITKLEPHFAQVWMVQAWNMAYNISVKFKENAPGDYTDRWRWVQRGIELLRDEGLKYNPDELLMYRELAWFFQHKMGANLDDGHAFYKAQWIMAMSPIFGSTNAIPVESLLHPVDDAGRERTNLLIAKFKMSPEKVVEVDKEFGPLDWRLPETHAIYWAQVGLQRAKEHPDRVKKDDMLMLRRMTYQSMQLAFQRGRLVANKFFNPVERPQYGPNLAIIPKVNATYEAQMAESPENADHIGTGHRNFLRDVVFQLYVNNREAEAAKWFKYLGEKYPNKTIIDGDTNSFPRNVSLDEFVFPKFEEAINEPSQNPMQSMLEGLITRSYMALIMDEPERATGWLNLARKARASYNAKVDASRSGAISMRPLDEIQKETLKRLLDPEEGLPDEMAAELATKTGEKLPPRVKKAEPATGSATNTPVEVPAGSTNSSSTNK